MAFLDRREIATDGGSAILVEEDPTETTTQAVLRGIAVLSDVPVCDLDPLYRSVDPESLNRLMEHSQRHTSDVSIEFTHEGCAVRLFDDGTIQITEASSGYG